MRIFKPGGLEALNDIPPEVIAEICRVHVTTARRWKRGEEPPFTALQLLKLHNDRELGVVDLKWASWRLVEGQLVAPHGERFGTGDVMSIRFLRQLRLIPDGSAIRKAGRLDQRAVGSRQTGGDYRLIHWRKPELYSPGHVPGSFFRPRNHASATSL